MKTLFCTLMFSMAALLATAQNQAIESANHHEIGVDAAPLLQQFFNFGNARFYGNGYSLMYRYHFNKVAIRAGVGGYARSSEDVTNDTIREINEWTRVDFRVGIERKVDFKMRWQFFYGIDFRSAFYTSTRRSEYNIANYYEDNGRVDYYGFSPLLGFRFKINDRISLTTESSFSFMYHKSRTERLDSRAPQYDRITTSKGYDTEFVPPVYLFFTFNF